MIYIILIVSGMNVYYLIVIIGVWCNVGLMVNVFIKVYGIEDILEVVDLIKSFLLGRKMFGRGSVDRFVFYLEKMFGNVIKIEMWYDNFGKNLFWFLD